jgi:hypothetical protein
MATVNLHTLSTPFPPDVPVYPGSRQEDDADEHKVNIDVYVMGNPA